jgi:Protein of unknown function (DUF3465)
LIVVVAIAVVSRLESPGESPSAAHDAGRVGCSLVASSFHRGDSGEWLTMAGVVSEILPDEHGTSTHQRFILRCPSRDGRPGQTVLIDNNVDVGQRAAISIGARVIVRGQYVWNDLGGLIHDTHHSTDSNPNGWVYSDARVYQ